MKILILGARSFPAKHGGLEVVVENLAMELAQLGDTVHVAVSDGIDPFGYPGVEIIRVNSVKGKYLHTASQMLSSLKLIDSSYDIVHIHGIGPSFILLLRKFFRWDTTFLVTIHGVDWDRQKWPSLARFIFRSIVTKSLAKADSLSSVSHSTAKEMDRFLTQPCVVIGNGLKEQSLDLAWRSGLPDKYSLALGRLTPEKNYETLVSAYSKEVSILNGPLVIVGDGQGSYASSYEQSLKEASPEWIIWLGYLDHGKAMGVLKNASGFLSASTLEAQPMAVIEAMGFGIPMILSDIPAHRELAPKGSTFFPPLDVQKLTELLLNTKFDSNRFSHEKLEHRSWTQIAQEYRTWFRDSISR